LRSGVRPSALRAWLGDGTRVLATVEVALDDFLLLRALDALARGGAQLEESDDPATSELSEARAEIDAITTTDFGPATLLLAAAGVGLVVIAAEAEALVHGHAGPDIVVHGHGEFGPLLHH
jgi:hypothetical protein